MIACLAALAWLTPAALSVNAGEPDQSPRLTVFVSILPQAYFVERIGGLNVRVEILVGPGQTPETYEPTPRQLTALAEADVLFTIGMPFEKRLADRIRRAFPDTRVVAAQDDHSSADANVDPHTWLSPILAGRQAKRVCEELCRLDTANTALYRKNLSDLQRELDSLDTVIRNLLESVKGKAFYVSHPAFGHFAEVYGLTQVAVEADGKEPSAQQLSRLIRQAKDDGVTMIFVQPQHSPKAARALAEAIGAEIVPLDPLARDYLNNLRHIAEQIGKTLTEDVK
ncbi:MAG: zinc ABC transporter substrate-binding protein [Candidatus Zixiibacteriota bacterium]